MNQIIQVKQAAAVFKALGDENRIRILLLLGGGELCACKLLEYLQISQSTLSHHMKILCDAGIVVGRKEGRWTHYCISQENVAQIRACVQMLTTPGGGIRCDCQS